MTWTGPKRRYRTVLLGFGCVLFVYLLVRLGAAEISSLLLGVGWYFGLIVATYAGHQLIRAIAYWKCVTANEHSSYWDIVRIRLSGEAIQFLTSTGPFLAEPAKVWLLRRRGLSTKHAVAATVSEYLIYTFTSAAFAIAGLTYLLINFELSRLASVAARVVICTMGAFLLAAICAVIFRVYLIGALIKGASRLPWIGKYVRLEENDVRDTEDWLFVVLRDRPLRFLLILAVEFAAQALLVLELFVLLRTTGTPFSSLHPFLIEAATKFLGLEHFHSIYEP
jgi:lysylphosphatidylglycerol synthase-like protein